MGFWQGFAALAVVAALFLLGPSLLSYRAQRQRMREKDSSDVSGDIFRDQMQELDNTLALGEIDSEQHRTLKQDLENTQRQDVSAVDLGGDRPLVSNWRSRMPLVILALLMPVLCVLAYTQLGALADWKIYQMSQQSAQTHAEAKIINGALILALRERLQHAPDNSGNWYLLAQRASEQGDYNESVRAFRKLREIEPRSPFVIAELAQALFLRAGNTITPEVRENTQMALAMNPNMPTALGLAGIDAYQTGDYAQAVTFWQKAVARLDPNSAASQALAQGIARAQSAIKHGAGKAPKEPAAAGKAYVDVQVSMDASIEMTGDETVFVYARAWQGAKMPLAIKKIKASELPLKVRLDSSSAMAQGMDITSVPQLEVLARLSKSGMAMPRSGDWLASFGPVYLETQKDPIQLKIDQKIP